MTATAPSTVRPLAVLRDATRERHEHLDAAFRTGTWLADVDRYAAYLAAIARCHRLVEAAVGTRPVLAETGYVPKSPLAAHDLRSLGHHVDLDAVEVARTVGDGAALGAVYVVEGSTLGGRQIARWVRTELPAAAAATRFLDVYGDDTTARWRRTVRAIQATHEPIADLVAGATWAFDVFADALLAGGRR